MQYQLESAIKELSAVPIEWPGTVPAESAHYAVHFNSRCPRHARWFVLTAAELPKVLLGMAVPCDKYGERLGVEMPAWWKPDVRTTWRTVPDDGRRGTPDYLMFAKPFETKIEAIGVDLATGDEHVLERGTKVGPTITLVEGA